MSNTAQVPGLRGQAEEILRALVGREDACLREDQWRAIEALVAQHRRVLVVERTGWGKSAVYFVATALLRSGASGHRAGPTVIVSPLLALMRDQIAAASRAGIRAVTINSANVTEWDAVHADIAAGEVDVLLCSPERLNNPAFRDQVLPRLAASAGLVVVDEAHCISDWGHDFRPDYRRIRTLLAELPAGIPVLATTATANARVSADVAEQLGLGAGQASPTTSENGQSGRGNGVLVLRGPLDRASLHLAVVRLADQAARVAWLGSQLSRWQGSGIVYALTVASAETVAAQLREAGHDVAAYTGRTDPAERERLEGDLKKNRAKALVATSALGMGFDKPDLGFVVHLGAPSSPIAYYQQVGRAGRGVDRADVVLLPGAEDQDIWAYFGSMGFPPEPEVRLTLEALAQHGTMSTAKLETHVNLRRSRLETMLKVLDVDGAVRRVRGGWETTGQEWQYDRERYERVARAREAEQRSMLEYVGLEDACRMAFLRGLLDDPELPQDWRCGRCDRCGGMELSSEVEAGALDQARAALHRPGVEVSARRQWPAGMGALGVELSGKIPESERAETGRAVARMDGLGWSSALRELFEARYADDHRPADDAAARDGTDVAAHGGRDGLVPPALRRAVKQVLSSWQVSGIDGVIMVSSATRPKLVEHLARGVAQVLGVPLAGAIGPEVDASSGAPTPPSRHDVNSAQRLAAVDRRLRLELSEAAAAGLPGRRVLLVDDFTDSGWTLTVGARLLRRTGADAVLPFVLAQR